MSTKSAEEQLQLLLKRNYDAEKGYAEVADKVEHPDLSAFMNNNSRQRNSFGHDIKNIMHELGIRADKGTSLEGDLHRAWINVREILAAHNDKAILDEAENGEKYAIEDYKEAVENPNLSPHHKRTLSDHLNSIMSSCEQVQKLKASLLD